MNNLLKVDGIHDKIPVGQHGALRFACCARCVDEGSRLVWTEILRKLRRRRQRGGLDAGADIHLLDILVVLGVDCGIQRQRLICKKKMRVGVFQNERCLTHTELEVDRHDYCAKGHYRHICRDILCAVAGIYADGGTLTDAHGVEPAAAVFSCDAQPLICKRSQLAVYGIVVVFAAL